jgi:shikimate dehydrogenase
VNRTAVLGQPISHSLSPVLHNAGYAAAGLTGWSFTAIECGKAELPGLVAGLGPEWAGLCITMPLKELALTVAAEVSPLAAAVGAANTLVHRPDGTWRADNTDVPGMVAALRDAGVDQVTQLAVLGAGGTARAALGAAHELGAAEVTVYARRPEAIAELAPVADALGLVVLPASWAQAAECGKADVVISTVPNRVADSLNVQWRSTTVLFDALYHPWPTPLAASAAAADCRIVSGLDLLLAQATRQFEQFTGVPAPVEAMRTALIQARRAA